MYWRGGALLSSVTSAGVHTKIPFITSVEYVQTTMQRPHNMYFTLTCGPQYPSAFVIYRLRCIEVFYQYHYLQLSTTLRPWIFAVTKCEKYRWVMGVDIIFRESWAYVFCAMDTQGRLHAWITWAHARYFKHRGSQKWSSLDSFRHECDSSA